MLPRRFLAKLAADRPGDLTATGAEKVTPLISKMKSNSRKAAVVSRKSKRNRLKNQRPCNRSSLTLEVKPLRTGREKRFDRFFFISALWSFFESVFSHFRQKRRPKKEWSNSSLKTCFFWGILQLVQSKKMIKKKCRGTRRCCPVLWPRESRMGRATWKRICWTSWRALDPFVI